MEAKSLGKQAGFERYHVEVKEAPWKTGLPPKFRVNVYNNCVNVQECVQACVYGAQRVGEDGKIAQPIDKLCRGCHRCALSCPKGAICVELNPAFEKLGDSYFTPERIENIYFEAETGRIPVTGAGYGGSFAGKGFDGFWFDFSEIVRPTRDGIHGREYVSTSVDLGRRPPFLAFNGSGELISEVPRTIELPIPIILDAPLLLDSGGKNLNLALARAASKLNTFSIIRVEDYSEDFSAYHLNLIPRVSLEGVAEFKELFRAFRIVELDCMHESMSRGEMGDVLKLVREVSPSTMVSVRIGGDERAAELAEGLVRAGVDIVHLHMEDSDVERNPDLVEAIRNVHSHLVDKSIRDLVSMVSSGGIAEAAHVPKSIAFGADAVAIGLAYQIALGCKVCKGTRHEVDCHLRVDEEDVDLASQRIINMVSSWRDQLLEVLGGMGMREVRRLRGELGRIIFYEELEERIFGDGK